MGRNGWMMNAVRAGLAAGVVLGAMPAFGQITREGSGERRAALNQMEREPVPAAVWESLGDWVGDEPVTSADRNGKVVLVVTWAGWFPNSHRGLQAAQTLHERHVEDGLVVIGVHNPRGFGARSEAVLGANGVKFPAAHDKGGKFYEHFRVQQDPEFYLFDRAGQLRFAHVSSSSLTEATRLLLTETYDDASTLNERLAMSQAERERELRRIRAINEDVDLRALPEIPFMAPDEQAYKDAGFPEMPRRRDNWSNDREVPYAAELPDEGWVGQKPAMDGRVTVVYFWSPLIYQSHERRMPQMEAIQRRLGRDVVVVGVLMPHWDDQSSWNQDQREIEEQAERLQKATDGFLRNRRIGHSVLIDPLRSVFPALQPTEQHNYGNDAWPANRVFIISSDSQVRWHGLVAAGFEGILDRIVANDPGVKARREAEADYIRAQRHER